MLRLFVLLLVLANAGYYAWSHGLLAAYGFAPASQNEPQRLAQQVRPEALRVVTPLEARQIESIPSPAASASASAATSIITSTATECLQVGLFNEEQTVVLKEQLTKVMPAGSWALEAVQEPARWMVYMGKYSSVEAVTKKKAELRGMGVSFAAPGNASLEPGLSLGNFQTQADADIELARIARKGVKTAKVLQDRVEQKGQRLKLASVSPALRSQLDAIKPQLAGKPFQTCS